MDIQKKSAQNHPKQTGLQRISCNNFRYGTHRQKYRQKHNSKRPWKLSRQRRACDRLPSLKLYSSTRYTRATSSEYASSSPSICLYSRPLIKTRPYSIPHKRTAQNQSHNLRTQPRDSQAPLSFAETLK